jgi:hypothetical protein
MSTLHIMLASGENLPNLIPAIVRLKDDPGFKADTALILESKGMRRRQRAGILKKALEYSGVSSVSIHPEDCPDDDLQQIRAWAKARAEEITANHHDNRRILNLTGGTKLMTIAFLEAFQSREIEAIYCDTAHRRIEYINDDRKGPNLPVDTLKLETCLVAQGYRLRKESIATDDIAKRAELTRNLVTSAPRIDRLIRSLNNAWYEYDKGKNFHAPVKNPHFGAEENRLLDEIEAQGLLTSRLAFSDIAAARYLGGGWLEEWCWLVGKELEKKEPGKRLKSDRWGVNLEIESFDAPAIPREHPLNELDAVYVHRNRMLIIECKTGMQISDSDKSQDILNKLETLGNQFGGRLNTKWLLTARHIKHAPVQERAQSYSIRIIEPQDIVHLEARVQEWMTSL